MDWKQLASGTSFAVGMLLLGFTAGGAIGGRLLGGEGMGWDRMGDMLGGVMVGLVIAAVVTGAVVSRLTHRQRLLSSIACVTLSILLVFVLQQTSGPSP